MKLFLLFSMIVLSVSASNLVIGDVSSRARLMNHTLVEYYRIPFIKRVKEFFYKQPDNRNIKGIQALDRLNSQASIAVTAGGIGFPFVNLRMKSERGKGLKYDINFYEQDFYYY